MTLLTKFSATHTQVSLVSTWTDMKGTESSIHQDAVSTAYFQKQDKKCKYLYIIPGQGMGQSYYVHWITGAAASGFRASTSCRRADTLVMAYPLCCGGRLLMRAPTLLPKCSCPSNSFSVRTWRRSATSAPSSTCTWFWRCWRGG